MLRKKKINQRIEKTPDGFVDIPEKLLEDFTPDSLQFYRHCFAMYDLNKDGLISANELSKVSVKLGYKMSNDDIEEMVRRWDRNHDGMLSFEEFVRAMPGSTLSAPEEETRRAVPTITAPDLEKRIAAIRRRFREFDLDGNGIVSFEEAHTVLKKELAFTRDQSLALFSRYDSNNDRKLNYNEFCKFYHRIDTRIEWVRMMFAEYDKDGSGSISVKECKKMLRKLNISDCEVESLVAKHDSSGDGELQYDEFVAFLMDQKDDPL